MVSHVATVALAKGMPSVVCSDGANKGFQDENFEKILSELDERIGKQEVLLADIKVRERYVLVSWLYYTIPAYLIGVASYFTVFSPKDDPIDLWLIKTVPVLVTPFL
ncbi:hypothetical protein HK101_006307 [Irineochytrium annulatum]|nr:hypothetical protein HK101_006307 [Irineochytrium annulatum]